MRSGRMCVAGLNSRNVDYVADAMAAVLQRLTCKPRSGGAFVCPLPVEP